MSVLVFCRDPGAANHLVALVERLERGDAALAPACALLGRGPFEVYARAYAHDVWRRAGIAARDWDAVAAGRDVDAVLAALAPSAVLTGTSDIDESTDCALWRAARRAGIPSACIVDYGLNAAVRFRDELGVVAPDLVLVPDEPCAAALAGAGVAPESIVVTGDLHLARLVGRSDEGTTRAALRAAWGAGAGDRVLLFASECGREMAAAGRPARYDEVEVLRALLETCAGAADAAATVVVARPHPRDDAAKYASLAAPQPLRLVVSSAGAPEEAIGAADEVVGMESTLLLEAVALGRPARSLTGWARLERLEEERWTAAS